MKTKDCLFLVVLVTLSSCCAIFKRCDDCEKVSCLNGGTCSDGKCSCPTGYSGTLCETKEEDEFATGWEDTENASEVPISVTSSNFFGSTSLPSVVDLTSRFPPVGDQGQYGTCVGWAVGYNSKSAMEAIAQGLSTSDLFSPDRQMSAKDLFWSIPNDLKAPNCQGTHFSYAMDQLMQRGVATMATVPYTNVPNCQQTSNPTWDNDASKHKIKNYRRINVAVNEIKEQLANNVPVIFGAEIYESFMRLRGDGVYNANVGSQNGSHAMVIIGYNDSKGSQGAFKILNSWGSGWGASGYAWVDYNFMVNAFIHQGNCYIMSQDSNVDPPNVDPDNPPVQGNSDLAAWVNSDFSNYLTSGYLQGRSINFNVYNIGSKAVSSSENWSFYYLYYDAYNANNYGVIFYDEFNGSVTQNSYFCPSGNHCTFNYSIDGGSNFSATVFNTQNVTREYAMPAITGNYYLVLVADPTGAISELDETNNFFYTTIQFPKYFQNGYSQRQSEDRTFINKETFSKFKLPSSPNYDRAIKENPNAYSIEEIYTLLKEQKRSGKLNDKLQEFKNQQISKNVYP